MFEKREVRFFPGLRRDDAWRKAWDWWGRQGFQLTKTGPYRMHGSSFYSRIGLRREFDAILDDADGGTNVDLSWRPIAPSLASLHDLHEAVGIEDLEFPLRQRGPELLPGDDLDPVVPAFRELNSVGSLDATRSKSFLLRLLDGVLDAYRLHHHPIPPGRGANRRARANLEVAI